MLNVNVYDKDGKQIDSVKMREEIYGIEPNEYVVHSVIVAYLRNQRQGTASTKTRGEIRGGGAKPWRQKGTGRARSGSIRSPLWKGGGTIFGPRPRKYTYRLNKRVKMLAYASVLADKVQNNEMYIIEEFEFDKPKTKEALKILENMELKDKKVLIVLDRVDTNVLYSFRNLPKVKVIWVGNVTVYDLVNYDKLIITKKAIDILEKDMFKVDEEEAQV